MKRALVADLFCGAGSLSMGANDALRELGYRADFVAVNHWPVAIATYLANHDGARAHCVTLDAAFPSQLVPEGRLDLLMAGIECTYFSRARGGKPVNDQQRMSAWHVVRWCTELRVKRLLLENVPEFVDWGPVNARTGKPIKSRKGEYFQAWWKALEAIGFKLEMRRLNCANFGDATTRERLFILGRSDGKPIRWPVPSHAKVPDMFGAERWRAARDIIDWDIRGRSIFDRKRPLAAKTLARIAAGIVKFNWPEPFLVVLRQHCDALGIDVPLPTITAGGTHIGLVEPQPFVGVVAHGNAAHERDPNWRRVKSIDDPLPTVHAGGNGFAIIEPFVLSNQTSGAPRSTDEPLPTITLGGAGNDGRPGCARHAVVEPFVLSQASGGAPRAASEPLPTVPGGGAHALIAPYYGSGSGETCKSVDDPLPTATAKARFGLVMPVTHTRAEGARAGDVGFVPSGDGCDGNRARPLDDPLPTITTGVHAEHGSAMTRGELAFIAASFGDRPTQAPRVHDIAEPAPTICATGRTNLVEGGPTPAREFDILFRMLEPHELAAAMSISTPEAPYMFTGNKTEVVRQIGQAVPRRTGRALAKALMEE